MGDGVVFDWCLWYVVLVISIGNALNVQPRIAVAQPSVGVCNDFRAAQ